jgi:hypothetical protein
MKKFEEELNQIKEKIAENKNSVVWAQEAIKKYEKQLKNIKNNREYNSLTKEVEFQNLEIQLADKHKIQNEASILQKQEIIIQIKHLTPKNHQYKNWKNPAINHVRIEYHI